MKKRSTLSIGIPAYNEEKTIVRLLNDVYSQDFGELELKEVIVVSDGSDDKTVSLVKSIKQPTLKLLAKKDRKGIATRLNNLCEESTGDCLIILNADIRIKDRLFVQKLSQPIVTGKADLTSCNQVPLKPSTSVEKALATSIEIKTEVFEKYLDGNNVYTCHGTARAFSKSMYKKISFPHSVGEDAYAYFFAVAKNMNYVYVTNTEVYYKLPTTLEDHFKQNKRFIQSQSQFIQEFGNEFMKKMYYLPQSQVLLATIKKAITAPVSTIQFIAIFILMKLRMPKEVTTGETWDIALSSKETE
jgi:glycosyltransferase involved in cell wall biosynthesis